MDEKRKLSIPRLINEYRVYLILVLMLLISTQARRFFTVLNIKSILDSTVLFTMIGSGFTLCMICGHMDLSVGLMANLGAIFAVGLHTLQGLPWAASISVALLAAGLAGVVNGILVTKGKIHSFIVTLGMQFVLRGIVYIYCGAGEIGVSGDYALGDWLNRQLGGFPFTPKFLITLAVGALLALLLWKTRFGRNVYITGGNRDTAWLGGVNTTATTIGAFAISGVVSALGGILFAIAQSSAAPNLGEKGISPLMVALAATVIGGTSTYGGKGSVWKTFVAVIALMTMNSALNIIYRKIEIQILANGLILAAVVLYETIVAYYAAKKAGARAQLLQEHRRQLAEPSPR